MVRRVGFGDSEKSPKKERDVEQPKPPASAGGGKRSTRLIVAAFLIVWLTLWSVAIAFAVNAIMGQGSGSADIGLFVWVGVASLFWLLAANLLWRVLTGQPLARVKKGPSRAGQRRNGTNRGDWDHGEND